MTIDTHWNSVKNFEWNESYKKGIDKLFIWAIFTSFGNAVTEEYYEKLNKTIVEVFNIDLLPHGSLFEFKFTFDKPEGEFIEWKTLISEFKYNPAVSFFDLLVPTKESVQFDSLITTAVYSQFGLFITG